MKLWTMPCSRRPVSSTRLQASQHHCYRHAAYENPRLQCGVRHAHGPLAALRSLPAALLPSSVSLREAGWLETRGFDGTWMRRVGVMRWMRMRLVRMMVRSGRRGSRRRARAGKGRCGARGRKSSELRGGRYRRPEWRRRDRTGRASCGCAGTLVRSATAASRNCPRPGRGYLSRARPAALALPGMPMIAGGRSRASECVQSSTPSIGESDLYGVTERDGPGRHDGYGNGDRHGGP